MALKYAKQSHELVIEISFYNIFLSLCQCRNTWFSFCHIDWFLNTRACCLNPAWPLLLLIPLLRPGDIPTFFPIPRLFIPTNVHETAFIHVNHRSAVSLSTGDWPKPQLNMVSYTLLAGAYTTTISSLLFQTDPASLSVTTTYPAGNSPSWMALSPVNQSVL